MGYRKNIFTLSRVAPHLQAGESFSSESCAQDLTFQIALDPSQIVKFDFEVVKANGKTPTAPANASVYVPHGPQGIDTLNFPRFEVIAHCSSN
jgi:hypothetical protein